MAKVLLAGDQPGVPLDRATTDRASWRRPCSRSPTRPAGRVPIANAGELCSRLFIR